MKTNPAKAIPVGGAFRPAMAWLHTWLGLGLAWVIYFMFVTGTAGYLDTEIDRWMRPELPIAHYPRPTAETTSAALDYLQTVAPDAKRWTIQLPIDRNEPYLHVNWLPASGSTPASPTSAWLDPKTGTPMLARDTAGGQTLYQMHWKLHYLPAQLAEWLVGVASMVLLLAVLTGIVVHRRFFADFFTFRPGKRQRSWLDLHNLASVLSLPFQLMISYSGLVFLMFSVMPLVTVAWYGATPDAVRVFYSELFPPAAEAQAADQRQTMASMTEILQNAQARDGSNQVAVLDIQYPNDANARISVVGNFAAGPLRAASILVYDGATGELLSERQGPQSLPRTSRDLLLGLHEGMFADPVGRALYVLSGLLGSAMIATGMLLWTTKRREQTERRAGQMHRGVALVERLNVAVILGLTIAIAAYFWANRLLPLVMEQRAQIEVHVLFGVWALLFLHAALTAPERAWRIQASLAAAAFAGLPVLNALTTSRHLGQSLPAGDWVMAGFDLGALALGLTFVLLVWKARRRTCG